jgi:hypothetical protein
MQYVYCYMEDEKLKVRQCVYCYMEDENLKLSGHYNTKRFNIIGFYVVSTHSTYVLCVDFIVRKDSDYFPMHYLVTGFYKQQCLLCGTKRIFKSNSVHP